MLLSQTITLTARAAVLAVAIAAIAACGAAPQPQGGAAATAAPTAPAADAATAYPPPTPAAAYPAPSPDPAYPAPLGQGSDGTAAPAPTRPPMTTTAAPTASGSASGSPLPAGLQAGPIPAERAGAALADLVQRTGATPADVTVVAAEAVEWSDGALGCPQEGMMYPQVISPGYRLVLAVAGREYAYHGGENGDLFYCERPAR